MNANIVYDHTVSVSTLSISRMADEYNAIMEYVERPQDRVSTFRDRAAAERRLTSARVELAAQRGIDESVSPGLRRLRASPLAAQLREAVLADQAAAAAVAAGRTEPKAPPADYPPPAAAPRRGRAPLFTDEQVVTLLVTGCPKREGSTSAKRWAKYRSGMTVGQFAKAVGDRSIALADLKWDVAHGFIRVE